MTQDGGLPRRSQQSASWFAFGLFAVGALVPIWSVRYLPMVDLPQHAAQISMWKHWNNPSFGFFTQVEMNPFTPYWMAYAIARAAAQWLPIIWAMKVAVSLAVVGLPASLRLLLRKSGLHPDWALLGFPLAYGFSFQWGFLNYVLAIPIGLAFVAYAQHYAERPSGLRAIGLAALGCLLFFGHVLVLGIAGGVAALVIAAEAVSPRRILLRCSPLLIPVALAAAWALRTQNRDAQVRTHSLWELSIARPFQVFSLQLGNAFDPVAWVGGVVILFLVLWGGLGFSTRRWAWLPAAFALLVCVLGPHRAFGTYYLQERFAVFVLPFLLFGLVPKRAEHEARARPLVWTFVAIWLGWTEYRHWGFDRDARDIDPLIARMEPNRRTLALTYDPTSKQVAGVPFLHHAVWYQVEKGGAMGFSFATFFPELFRYRPGAEPPMTPGLEWYPERFSWHPDGSSYDYYLIRSPQDVGARVFANTPQPERVVLEGHSGWFWLYRHERGLHGE